MAIEKLTCEHCGELIHFEKEEIELYYEMIDCEIIAKDCIIKVYVHSKNNEHLCDSGKTVAKVKVGG